MTIEELARKHGFDKKDNDFSNVMSFARELVEQCAQIANTHTGQIDGAWINDKFSAMRAEIASEIRALAGERK